MSFGRRSIEAQALRRQAQKAAHLSVLVNGSRGDKRGTYEGGELVAQPKPEARYEDKALTDMAEGRPCLLMVPAVCNHRTDTTVACHSNLQGHGKGLSRKADDQYTAWGCAACHEWLDRSGAGGLRKMQTFMAAHARQVLAWRLVAMDQKEPQRFRNAARRALERLNATPIGEER